MNENELQQKLELQISPCEWIPCNCVLKEDKFIIQILEESQNFSSDSFSDSTIKSEVAGKFACFFLDHTLQVHLMANDENNFIFRVQSPPIIFDDYSNLQFITNSHLKTDFQTDVNAINDNSNNRWVTFKCNNKEDSISWVNSIRAHKPPQTEPISISMFHPIRELGHGSYGVVNLCQKIDTNEIFAVKTINKKQLSEKNRLQTAIAENHILKSISFPFIVHLYYAFQDNEHFYLVLEFVPGGDLKKRIDSLKMNQVHVDRESKSGKSKCQDEDSVIKSYSVVFDYHKLDNFIDFNENKKYDFSQMQHAKSTCFPKTNSKSGSNQEKQEIDTVKVQTNTMSESDCFEMNENSYSSEIIENVNPNEDEKCNSKEPNQVALSSEINQNESNKKYQANQNDDFKMNENSSSIKNHNSESKNKSLTHEIDCSQISHAKSEYLPATKKSSNQIMSDNNESSPKDNSLFFTSNQEQYLITRKVDSSMSIIQRIELDDIRLYVAEISLSLKHLHDHGCIYRDLKPENVLLDVDGHIKLTDFGLSKQLNCTSCTNTFCGTYEYLAPEIIKNQPYNYKIDWWALGILIFELLFNRTPFVVIDGKTGQVNQTRTIDKIVNKDFMFPNCKDQGLCNLVYGLLEKDPNKRFGFDEVKTNNFMQVLDFEKVMKKEINPIYTPSFDEELDIQVKDNEIKESKESETKEDENNICIDELNLQSFSFNYESEFSLSSPPQVDITVTEINNNENEEKS